jgi:hypothetical protein
MSLEDKILEKRGEREFEDSWAGCDANMSTTESDTYEPRGFDHLRQYDMELRLRTRTKCTAAEWTGGARSNATRMLFDAVYRDITSLLYEALNQVSSRDREGAMKTLATAVELTKPQVI